MDVTILVCTHGSQEWERRAWLDATPSALTQSCRVDVHHDPHGTLAESRNYAAEQAKTDWLCFLDADDQLQPNYITTMAKAAEHETEGVAPVARSRKKALLIPGVQYVRDGMKVGSALVPNKGRWPVLNECVIGTLVQRDLFLEVGGFRELERYEDWDLWLRCWDAGASLVYVPEAVYVATMRADGRNGKGDQGSYNAVWAAHRQRVQARGDVYLPAEG